MWITYSLGLNLLVILYRVNINYKLSIHNRAPPHTSSAEGTSGTLGTLGTYRVGQEEHLGHWVHRREQVVLWEQGEHIRRYKGNIGNIWDMGTKKPDH